MSTAHAAPASWAQLLTEATTKPGKLSEAYHAFHNYSLGNQLLAMFQCSARELPLGPLSTYKGWQAKGRQVRRGEKALTLCMPVTIKREPTEPGADPECFQAFVYRPNWFTLAQTDGPDYSEAAELPAWSRESALAALEITQEQFQHADGNCQGYARARSIAVNPLAALPHKTTFHELAHVVLGHTSEGECSDAPELPRSLREAEAEATAYILTSVLDLPGADSARAYIQNWLGGGLIPEKSARRIFGAAQEILAAGRADALCPDAA